jgi:hypothetical protein
MVSEPIDGQGFERSYQPFLRANAGHETVCKRSNAPKRMLFNFVHSGRLLERGTTS